MSAVDEAAYPPASSWSLLFLRGSEAVEGVSVDIYMGMLRLFLLLHKVMVGVAFVKTVAATNTGCLHQHRLKPEILSFMTSLSDNIVDAKGLSIKTASISGEQALPWVLTEVEISNWLAAAEGLAQRFRRFMVGTMLSDTYSLAEQLAKDTPQYTHYVSEDVYRSTLVKKHLLHFSKKEALGNDSVLLSKLSREVSMHYQTFTKGGALAEDKEFGESVAYCQSAFRSAKRALTLMAAVQVIDGMPS